MTRPRDFIVHAVGEMPPPWGSISQPGGQRLDTELELWLTIQGLDWDQETMAQDWWKQGKDFETRRFTNFRVHTVMLMASIKELMDISGSFCKEPSKPFLGWGVWNFKVMLMRVVE